MKTTPEADSWPDMLSRLEVPEPSQDFAARIIAEATPRSSATVSIFRTFFDNILIPKPALAFAFVFSLMIGWQASMLPVLSDVSANMVTTDLSGENGVLDSFNFAAGQIL